MTTLCKSVSALAGAMLAVQETNAAVAPATLAAVNEDPGTCLQSIAAPAAQSDVMALLDVPHRFVPVWLQLLGYSAESRDGGGQRPRAPLEDLFAWRRWGTPFSRDPEVFEELDREGLLQPEAPSPAAARSSSVSDACSPTCSSGPGRSEPSSGGPQRLRAGSGGVSSFSSRSSRSCHRGAGTPCRSVRASRRRAATCSGRRSR